MNTAASSASVPPREGILAAIHIPTDAEGRVLRDALATHVAWLRERGVHGLLALGSSGEFPRFSLGERKELLAVLAEVAVPMPVLANVSDLRPDVAAALARHARVLGLPGVAVMPPWFYPLPASDQLAFFLHVAEAAQLPVYLYNFPERTGNRISLETIAAFADRAPLAGIKQSGLEFDYHGPLVQLGREKGFVVFSGADTRLPEAFAYGAAGCIGGMVNFVPEPMLACFRAWKGGDRAAAEAARTIVADLGAVINRLPFPLSVAAGVAARGFPTGEPKFLLSPETTALFSATVAAAQARLAAHGLRPVAAPAAAA